MRHLHIESRAKNVPNFTVKDWQLLWFIAAASLNHFWDNSSRYFGYETNPLYCWTSLIAFQYDGRINEHQRVDTGRGRVNYAQTH